MSRKTSVKSVTPVRAEVLAQALAARFPDDNWEWNEVADFVVREFLLLERRLVSLVALLKVPGATYVTWEMSEPSKALQVLMDSAGVKLETRNTGHREERVLVLSNNTC